MEHILEVEDEEFELEKAVCNYGMFMMAPNQWLPSTKTFRRPLRLANGSSSALVSISQPSRNPKGNGSTNFLRVCVSRVHSLSSADEQAILRQVRRMLRLSKKDEHDVKVFQNMHGEAKSKGFGRLFRSPDLFEDLVKTILLCNIWWNGTLQMSKALCELQAELNQSMNHTHIVPPRRDHCQPSPKIKFRTTKLVRSVIKNRNKTNKSTQPSSSPDHTTNNSSDNRNLGAGLTSSVQRKPLGNFPSAKELVSLREILNKKPYPFGYRAKYILMLAEMVNNGGLNLEEFGELERHHDDASYIKNIYSKLLGLDGFGPFAAANVLMCIGVYHKIPTDTETIKHLHKAHGRTSCNTATLEEDVRQIYGKYDPYQCLAYWYELVESYEEQLGKRLSKLSHSSYHMVTSSFGNKRGEEEEKKEEEEEYGRGEKRKAPVDQYNTRRITRSMAGAGMQKLLSLNRGLKNELGGTWLGTTL